MALVDWLPYVTAVWFFAAGGYLAYHRRERDGFESMDLVVVYLLGIGLFFVLRGWEAFATTSCPAVDCTDLTSSLAVMIAAAVVARFPLRRAWPYADVWIFFLLVTFAVLSQVTAALLAPAVMLPLAYGFAVVVVVGFCGGYLGSQLLRGDASGERLRVDSPVVVVTGLIVVVSLPLLGVPLEAPLLSTVLSPVAFAAVYGLVDRVDPDEAFAGEDATA